MRKCKGDVIQNDLMKHSFCMFYKKIAYFSLKLAQKCWMPFAILVITFAILISVFRALTPFATQYKHEVEDHLSALLGQPVKISSMETSWYWFNPVLKLNQVSVADDFDHVLNLNKLLVGINVFSSLWHWQIEPGVLYLDGLQLNLRQRDHHWEIDGLDQRHGASSIDPKAFLPVLAWLLRQQKIVINNLSALVHLENGALLPISQFHLTSVNHGGYYRLKGTAQLSQTTRTKLMLLADLTIDPAVLNKLKGHVYLSIQQFLPAQWQNLFPNATYHIDNGRGDLEVWFDIKKGHVSGGQAKIQLHRMSWSTAQTSQHQFIQYAQGNFDWNVNHDGWVIRGDQIKLRSYGQWWPENALLLSYKRSQQSYQFFVKHVLIEPLIATNITWPDVIKPIISARLTGHLFETQLGIKQGKIDNVLTRFSDLSWQHQGSLPGVHHLSGALSWQINGGRLEFDGENTTIIYPKLPPIHLALLNLALEWKELSHGLRVSLERLVMSRPDLVLSAQGAIDEPFSPETRHLQLKMEFSANSAEKWLAYIPSGYMKLKLEHWLKHDIKKIANVSGQAVINGLLAHFPFDKMQGEFSIVSRCTGVDLLFHKKWPLARDVDMNIRLNKRALEFDVLHANLNGVDVNRVNMRLDDLGMDRETLLLHGQVKAPATKMKSYVLASPLKRHLARLDNIDISDDLGLDLRLEIPLYPENDDVLARGEITFDDNQLTFHHLLSGFKMSHLAGLLNFNEQGVMDSHLKGSLLGGPVVIHMQSIRAPKPGTEVSIAGDVSIDLLREQFKAPLLASMQGHASVMSLLSLTDDPNDFDHMLIKSSLNGIQINLPSPLGKSFESSVPLSIDLGFQSEKSLQVAFSYDNRLDGQVSIVNTDGVYLLASGKIHLGSGPVQWKKQQGGVQVIGSLPTLDLQQWRAANNKLFSKVSSSDWLNDVRYVEVILDEFTFRNRHYSKLLIKANHVTKGRWSLQFDQPDLAGNLTYQSLSNTVSGRMKRLFLPQWNINEKKEISQADMMKPTDIPNLNLSIDAFKVGDIEVGQVAISARSVDGRWILDHGNIISPSYKVDLKGEWVQKEGRNSTTLQTSSQIIKFGELLKRWDISPALEARKGSIHLNLNWSDALTNFSLAHANGEMYMQFQNGRITHLSRETEEKLGFGKVLSILSLQTIPRRLKLDFSDLSKNGYSFDKLQGNFLMKNGVLTTSNTYIDGPVAYASMRGNINLARQLFDLHLHVSPHITASLPIVATIAGGPIAGIAAWVASKIINQSMQEITGYSYKVSGPWSDPVVQQVSIFKKKK